GGVDGADRSPRARAAARSVQGAGARRRDDPHLDRDPAARGVLARGRRAALAREIHMNAPLPRFVQIEPVGQCNLRCRMCPIQYRQDGPPHGPPAFLDEGVFRRLVESFGPIDELQLQGLGEPMMHPRFFDMVAFAAQRGIRVSTNTNLTLLTPRRAALCVDSGLAALHASLDGATASTYEFIRVGANFGKVIRNLDRLM